MDAWLSLLSPRTTFNVQHSTVHPTDCPRSNLYMYREIKKRCARRNESSSPRSTNHVPPQIAHGAISTIILKSKYVAQDATKVPVHGPQSTVHSPQSTVYPKRNAKFPITNACTIKNRIPYFPLFLIPRIIAAMAKSGKMSPLNWRRE